MTISRWETAVGAVSAIMLAAVVGTASGETAKARRRRRIRTPSRRSPATPRRTSSRRGSSRARSRRARSRSRTERPTSRSTATTATARWFRRRATCRPRATTSRRPRASPTRTRTSCSTTRTARTRTTTTAGTSSSRATSSASATSRASTSTPTTRTGSRSGRRRTRTAFRCRPSTVRRGTRGRSASCSPRRTAPTAACGSPRSISRRWSRTSRASSAAAGFEGIQNDSDGNLWIAEDVSGAKGTVNKNARQPNSFIFRFLPNDKHDLTKGGKLQALQVCRLNVTPCDPIVFHANDVDGDILSQNQKDLHTYGNQFKTNWVAGPRHGQRNDALRRERARQGEARDAVQAARERAVPSGQAVQGVLLRRDRRHGRRDAGRAPSTAASAPSSS